MICIFIVLIFETMAFNQNFLRQETIDDVIYEWSQSTSKIDYYYEWGQTSNKMDYGITKSWWHTFISPKATIKPWKHRYNTTTGPTTSTTKLRLATSPTRKILRNRDEDPTIGKTLKTTPIPTTLATQIPTTLLVPPKTKQSSNNSEMTATQNLEKQNVKDMSKNDKSNELKITPIPTTLATQILRKLSDSPKTTQKKQNVKDTSKNVKSNESKITPIPTTLATQILRKLSDSPKTTQKKQNVKDTSKNDKTTNTMNVATNPFSTFIMKVFEQVASKDEKHAGSLFRSMKDVFYQINDNGTLDEFDLELRINIKHSILMMNFFEPNVVQNQTKLLLDTMRNNVYDKDTKAILDQLDSMYLPEEGKTLHASLENLIMYPANDITSKTVAQSLISGVLQPYYRPLDTDKPTILTHLINEAVDRRIRKQQATNTMNVATNPFSTFIMKVFEQVASKDAKYAGSLFRSTMDVFYQIKDNGTLDGFGSEFKLKMKQSILTMNYYEPEVMQNKAKLLLDTMRNNVYDEDMKGILDHLDSMYLPEEGKILHASLENLIMYPANDMTSKTVVQSLISGILQPYNRLLDPEQPTILANRINEAVDKRISEKQADVPVAADSATNTMNVASTNPFSTFVMKVMEHVASKDEKHAGSLFRTLNEMFDKINDNGTLDSFGLTIRAVIYDSIKMMTSFQPKDVQNQAKLKLDMLRNNVYDEDIKKTFDYLDSIYLPEEGKALHASLENLIMYPAKKITPKTVVNSLISGILQPYKRPINAVQPTILANIADKTRNKIPKKESVRRTLSKTDLDALKEINDGHTFVYEVHVEPTTIFNVKPSTMKEINDGRRKIETDNTIVKLKININDTNFDRNETQSKSKEFTNRNNSMYIDTGTFLNINKQKQKEVDFKKHVKDHLKNKHSKLYQNYRNKHKLAKEHDDTQRKKQVIDKFDGYHYEKLHRNRYLSEGFGKLYTIAAYKTVGHKNIKRIPKKSMNRQRMVLQKSLYVADTHNQNSENVIKRSTESSKNRKEIASSENNYKRSRYLTIVSPNSDMKQRKFNNEKDILRKKAYKDKNFKITKNKGIFEDSSYSDEENELKFMLQDAIRHGDRRFIERRNYETTERTNINDVSSYSDEEAVLKNNVYKVFGNKESMI